MEKGLSGIYRAVSLMVCVKKASKFMLHLVEFQHVNTKSAGIAPVDGYTFFCERGLVINTWRPFLGLRGRSNW
jgi:hypothetical protein